MNWILSLHVWPQSSLPFLLKMQKVQPDYWKTVYTNQCKKNEASVNFFCKVIYTETLESRKFTEYWLKQVYTFLWKMDNTFCLVRKLTYIYKAQQPSLNVDSMSVCKNTAFLSCLLLFELSACNSLFLGVFVL